MISKKYFFSSIFLKRQIQTKQQLCQNLFFHNQLFLLSHIYNLYQDLNKRKMNNNEESMKIIKDKLAQFKKTIQFALTFYDCPILIYNKHIISPYSLAINGFAKKHLSQSEALQSQAIIAICQNEKCRKNIKMDHKNEGIVVRDQIQFALIDHDEECSYKSKYLKRFSQTDIYEYGFELYHNIQQTYKSKDLQFLDHINVDWKEVQLVFQLKKTLQMSIQLQIYKSLDVQFDIRQKKISKNIIFSIFGWQFKKQDQQNISLKCRYCGKCFLWSVIYLQTRSKKWFSFMNSHHEWCLIKNYSGWKMIMKRLSYNKLDQTQGDFCRTEQQILAKTIREDIFQMSRKYFTLIDNLIDDNEKCCKDSFQKIKKNNFEGEAQTKDNYQKILKEFQVKASNLNLVGKLAKDIMKNFINKIKI